MEVLCAVQIRCIFTICNFATLHNRGTFKISCYFLEGVLHNNIWIKTTVANEETHSSPSKMWYIFSPFGCNAKICISNIYRFLKVISIFSEVSQFFVVCFPLKVTRPLTKNFMGISILIDTCVYNFKCYWHKLGERNMSAKKEYISGH